MENIEGNEIWKDITGWEGQYQVSNFGRARSLDRVYIDTRGAVQNLKGKVLVGSNCNGYISIKLCYAHKAKFAFLHRMVAIEFIPNPENKPFVNHLDGNKRNCHVSNMEWATRLENARHASLTGLQKKGTQTPSAVLTEEIVAELRKLHQSGKGPSEISRLYNFKVNTVYQALMKKSWKHVSQ